MGVGGGGGGVREGRGMCRGCGAYVWARGEGVRMGGRGGYGSGGEGGGVRWGVGKRGGEGGNGKFFASKIAGERGERGRVEGGICRGVWRGNRGSMKVPGDGSWVDHASNDLIFAVLG